MSTCPTPSASSKRRSPTRSTWSPPRWQPSRAPPDHGPICRLQNGDGPICPTWLVISAHRRREVVVSARRSAGLLGAGDGVPGAADGEIGGDAEDAGVGGAGDGPVAAAEDAAGAAGDRPVRREVDADEELAGALDVQGEALAADPAGLGSGGAERGDERLRVPNRVDAPVLGTEAQIEVGGPAEDQAALFLGGVVERGVGQGDVGNRVGAQPGAEGPR